MVDRVEIKALSYMMVEGQPRLVDIGSVVDVPDASRLSHTNTTLLAEAAGTLDKPTHAKVIRNGRFR